MKHTTPWLLTLLILTALLQPSRAMANNDIACDSLGGAVVFKNMFYGIGIGAVLTGLVIAAQDNYEKSGQKLAQGSLIGASLGLGLGIYEVSTRTCGSAEESKNKLLQPEAQEHSWHVVFQPVISTHGWVMAIQRPLF